MKCIYLFLLVLVPLTGFAQQNEPVKSGKKATVNSTTREEYNFPDHFKFYKKELNERVEKKTTALTQCLENLAVKKGADSKREMEIAMKLFNNDETKMVTVTSKKHPEPVTMPIRKYMEHLAGLHYNKITITWHNARYMSNFIKQPDGTFAAVVAFEQEFVGVKKGEVKYTYRDLTKKRVEVAVKVWDVKEGDKITKEYMDVFLGNIGVSEQ